MFEAYKLDKLGSNYYLGVVHDRRSDGGKNGNKDMQYLTYYILLVSKEDFIILDEISLYNEYYQTNDLGLMDISNQIDPVFYTANQ